MTPELDALVGKLTSAFLETRWVWPRQFSQLAPSAFILSDPRVQELDKEALQALSRELQQKLFGVSGSGEVALMVFEGDEMEVHRFAGLEADALRQIARGDGGSLFPPFEGQLSKVTAKGAEPVALRSDDLDWVDTASRVSFSTPKFERNYEPVYRGLYFIPSRCFFGNIALCKPLGALTLRDLMTRANVLPGVATEEFDEGCVESAAAALTQTHVEGQLHVPLNFSSLVRPAMRQVYAEFLGRLPAHQKPKLVAAIYETPRDPSFFALSQMRKFLMEHFGQISLQVSDPAFEIEKLAPGVVTSVNLILPEIDPPARIAAIRKFMANRELFKRKQIWPGVMRVANRAEFEACLTLRAPVVSGPGVADLMLSPIGNAPRDFDALPLRTKP